MEFTAKQTEAVLIGVAVGDALGVPVEFCQRGSFSVSDMIGHGTHNQTAGTWSDDTSLMLCLADAIAETDNFSNTLKRTAENILRWYMNAEFTAHGEVFDVGTSTLTAIRKLKNGVPPTKSGCEGVYENGNGSLMRIAPLAFYVADKLHEDRFEIVRQISAITHAHPISVISCMVYVEYLLKLLSGEDKYSAYEGLQYEDVQEEIFKLEEGEGYFGRLMIPGKKIYDLPEAEIKSGGFVTETLEAAIWCFLNTDSYRGAVLKAVNLGSDTDTTAAVTGGLAGAYYGFGDNGIPPEWVKKLAKHKEISDTARRMFEGCI